MAIGVIMEFDGWKAENYDAVSAEINWPSNWPEGLTFHVAGPTEQGMRLVEIWDSPEQRERWMDGTINPALEKVAGDVIASSPPPRFTEFEVHALESR
jgi:hypothetical protein